MFQETNALIIFTVKNDINDQFNTTIFKEEV